MFAFFTPALSSAALIDSSIINEAQCNDGEKCTLNTFVKLGISVANYILTIVGALALLMFIYGGFRWILSGGSSENVQKGKDILVGSVVGLLIVFSSYMIISFVTNTLLGAKGDYQFTGNMPVDNSVPSNSCTRAGGTCKKPCNLGNKTIAAGNKYCNDNGGGSCCDNSTVDSNGCSAILPPPTNSSCLTPAACEGKGTFEGKGNCTGINEGCCMFSMPNK